MTLGAGGWGNGYYSDGNVANRTRTTHTHHGSRVRTPVSLPWSVRFCLLQFKVGCVPWSPWFMANRRLWGGMGLPRRPMEHLIAVLYGDLKATFGTDLVCAAVQQGKTMYCEL